MANHQGSAKPDRSETKAYLVGGGIASLAAAAFLIRDGHVLGQNITIFEELDRIGGSLDGAGSPETGYVLRGGRMFEREYRCTFGLFSDIPTLDKKQTVTQEILEWNEIIKTGSKSRLVRAGRKIDTPEFGLSERHILTLERLAIEPEALLGTSSIEDQFDASFFETNFWLMWCTTFAFQPWHSAVEFKRYLVRFVHMVDGFNQLKGIMRTVYNQYDSLVRPLKAWLDERGVVFVMNARVTDLMFNEESASKTVERIFLQQGNMTEEIVLGADDIVIVTLGSMTEASSLGSSSRAPELRGKRDGGAWALWERIALGRPEFGEPSAFTDHIEESKWISFTSTQRDPAFFNLMRDFTGNVPGEGGLVTFADSNWLMSIVLPYQPHFIGQPADVNVFWGYGLYVDRPGNFVKKPMAQCSGDEIMTEVLGHLRIEVEAKRILDTTITIPCMMPFITSQFLRRAKGDRPSVVPSGWRNLGFAGQFVEVPDDVVFTVEYSIRTAQAAVCELLDLPTTPPPVYKGEFNPRVLFKAFAALHDLRG
ncbi:oleate hydratase [Methyloferula stellata]|uniref:oleate hydratase n=1 Tax=Methyloferula stellata TaxID=876270 RepID=UPI00037AB326|nr:oleate hydratase [Methyloferula stellata]